jgi:uncharacterized protein (DUF4415 family)
MKAKRASGRRSSAVRAAARARRSGASNSGASKAKSRLDLQAMKISDFYRPLKKPITVRIDADVLAWFKKDGKRYQSRINAALRKVMEREMKSSG